MPRNDDGVDRGMARHDLEDGGDGVLRLAAGHVDGIVAAPAGREVSVQLCFQVVGQREQRQPAGAADGVGRDHAPTAGGRHDAHVRALRAAAGWRTSPPPRTPLRSSRPRTTPACRHAPSKTRSSVARLPVWLAAARAPTSEAPPFTTTSGIRSATDRIRSKNARPSVMPFDVGEPDVASRDRRRRSRGSRARSPQRRCRR